MSPSKGEGPSSRVCRSPSGAGHQPGPGIKVKAGKKPAGISTWPQHPASLSLQAPGRVLGEGGAAGPHYAWGKLSLSFSQPKELQGCC